MSKIIQMPITTMPLLADSGLNKIAKKSKDESEAASFKIRWKNFIEITKSKKFSKNYPVTNEHFREVYQHISMNSSDIKKIENEQRYILSLFEREKFWRSYKIPVKLDKNNWQSLAQNLKSAQFQKKYPITYLYYNNIGDSRDSLKRLLLELYNKEKLLNSGKISKADFNVYYFKICFKTIKYLEQIFIGSVGELSELMYPGNDKKIKKKQSYSLTLADLKMFRNKNAYPYTFYFLKDKNINSLSVNDLNKARELIDADNMIRINNFAYDVLHKGTNLFNELNKFWDVRGKKYERTMDSRFAYCEAGEYFLKKTFFKSGWHEGHLELLSEQLYGCVRPITEAKNFEACRIIFSGKIIKPENLEENIKALKILPPGVLKYLEENNVRIVFYPYIEKTYVKAGINHIIGYAESERKKVYNAGENPSTTLHEIGHLIFDVARKTPEFREWFRKFIELVEKRKSIRDKLKPYLYKEEKPKGIISQHIKSVAGYLDYVEAVIDGEYFSGFILTNRNALEIDEKNEYFADFFALYFEYIKEQNNPNYYFKNLPNMDSEMFELFKELQSLLS